MTSLVWIRRDMRLHDQAALATALQDGVPVQPVFVFDSEILARFSQKNDRRLSFLAATLCHMNAQLRARGGSMLVLHGKAAEVMPKLAATLNAKAIYSAEDFEPATIARDAAVKQSLPATTRFVQVLDHLLRAPALGVKADGQPYKVFTPFYKLWRASLGPTDWAEYAVKDTGRYADGSATTKLAQASGLKVVSLEDDPAKLLAQIGYEYAPDAIWRVDDVQSRVSDFISTRLKNYGQARNTLADERGTSRLSPYLRFGLVSIRELMRATEAAGGGEKWISELGWREFYASILFHFPEITAHEFMPQYRHGAIPWVSEGAAVEAFKAGRTGYPVVDAAVRELLTTGYMHNRARMIVASFASKDLLMDWRVGEEFFAQHLMDYDLASNVNGWQWSSSTGTDAAPYFRVFNPTLQSKKFDADGSYIRRYVPELAHLNADDIHWPHDTLLAPKNYPAPIVDHFTARDRAVAVFKVAKAN